MCTFLDKEGIERSINDVDRGLRNSFIESRSSYGIKSRQAVICRSWLVTFTTRLRQQVRVVWQYPLQALIAHHRSGVMPSMLPGL